jgi:16S rRNA (uracil1498-N3)-methyltransferase
MHRLFVDKIPESGVILITDGDQLHHLRDVLRASLGDDIVVCDSIGNECLCSIDQIATTSTRLKVKTRNTLRPAMTALTIACAIPKKGKMDDIIDKLTQLGVDGIIPMVTTRVIVRLDAGGRQEKLQRWQRIAIAASQQSQRSRVPVISPISEIKDVLAFSTRYDIRLLLTLSVDGVNLHDLLTGSRPSHILVLIGPEGDFTPEEVELARGAGFIPVSLGTRVLRVETATVAVAGYISLSLGI